MQLAKIQEKHVFFLPRIFLKTKAEMMQNDVSSRTATPKNWPIQTKEGFSSFFCLPSYGSRRYIKQLC